jgi:ActR/RegA family two-component response regulator
MEDTSPDLSGVSVLIVEDETYVALDLAAAVECAGGLVLGPVATVREALELARQLPVAAAIVDVELPDGHIGPVLDVLLATRTTVVVHSAVGLPSEIAALHPQVPVFMKPTQPSVIIMLIAMAFG